LKYENTTAFRQPYDFGSVLHYASNDFAKDPNVWTIKPKPPFEDKQIGQREWLSETDIKKINLMYKCPTATTTLSKTLTSGT
jgi:Astacin (Peptidase family M12A)